MREEVALKINLPESRVQVHSSQILAFIEKKEFPYFFLETYLTLSLWAKGLVQEPTS